MFIAKKKCFFIIIPFIIGCKTFEEKCACKTHTFYELSIKKNTEDDNSIIKGSVRLYNGLTSEGFTIRCISETKKDTIISNANENGLFLLIVPPGSYTVKVFDKNHVSKETKKFSISNKRVAVINFCMISRPDGMF